MKLYLLISFALLLGSAGSVVAADPAFDPVSGFRISQYRAPTPQVVPGGTTITLEDLQKLVAEKHAILLDVTPSEGAGADPQTGVWHLPKPRLNMAGSVWLPDVGKGVLSAALDRYFQTNLARLSGNNKLQPIVIYCQADCWMSWNAVKRASGYGYGALYWYPDGTDGMRDWDVPLVPSTPVPMAPQP
jgi:PQQ-dependent catabolism-associated CXXCW motif protein